MSGHTPGPWVARELTNGTHSIDRAEGADRWYGLASVITMVESEDDDLAGPAPSPEGIANARLIATAPELLIELRQAVVQLEMVAECLTEGRHDEALLYASSLMRTKRNAIAKATGATP